MLGVLVMIGCLGRVCVMRQEIDGGGALAHPLLLISLELMIVL